MPKPIRVLIADDTEIAREGLRRLLGDTPDIVIIGEARTVYEVVQMVLRQRPDILLMDLKWYGDDTAGTSAIEYLCAEAPQTKIIAITVYDHLIRPAREAGAHLAITKDFSRDELHRSIREVYEATGLPPARTSRSPEGPLVEPLTEREVEALVVLAEGLPDREIADRLGITENTVKHHVSSILGKLGAQNRTQAVVIAVRKGLLKI